MSGIALSLYTTLCALFICIWQTIDSVGWISAAHPPFAAVLVDALRLST